MEVPHSRLSAYSSQSVEFNPRCCHARWQFQPDYMCHLPHYHGPCLSDRPYLGKMMLNSLIRRSNFTIRNIDLETLKDAWNKEAVQCDLLWHKVIPFHHNQINFSSLREMLAAVLSMMKQPLISFFSGWGSFVDQRRPGLAGYRRNQR